MNLEILTFDFSFLAGVYYTPYFTQLYTYILYTCMPQS